MKLVLVLTVVLVLDGSETGVGGTALEGTTTTCL